MTFGTDIGRVHRARNYAGETQSTLSGTIRKTAQVEPVTVTIEATQDEHGNYDLIVGAAGESTTVHVDTANLGDECARLITMLAKAIRAGTFKKAKQPTFNLGGMSMPHSGRDNLRFG